MKIYGSDLSAVANKVRMVANAVKLDYDYCRVDLAKGEHQQEAFLKINPAGKVPALVDDGFALFESNAIIRYLAQKSRSDLYPQDLQTRAVVEQWLDFVSIHIGGAIGRILFNKVFAPRRGWDVDEKSLECGIQFLGRFLPVVEQQLAKTPYLAGERMTLADLNLLATIDPLEVIEWDITPYPHLKKWRTALQGQEFYQKVHKFYGEMLLAKK